MTLEELRARLNELDHQLLRTISERQGLANQIAEVKRATGHPLRDYARERQVIVRARTNAAGLSVSPALAEELMHLLIRESLTSQERAHVAAQGRGGGQSALVIGGAGKMGRWFAQFLESQGYRAVIADPAGPVPGFAHVADWRTDSLDHDLIIVATQLKTANLVLQELATRKPRGVVLDIGSLKTPLRRGLTALRDAGCRVTSLHPMFGPDTELLSHRHVIFIDMGNPEALHQAQELFASTMAERVVMSLDEHDRLIAYVLGLSHALNIAFFTALADSGEAAPRLAKLSSTTFDAQMEVARKVSAENPQLYFEIQNLNEYGLESLLGLKKAIDRLYSTVSNKEEGDFIAMMGRGREYFEGRSRGD